MTTHMSHSVSEGEAMLTPAKWRQKLWRLSYPIILSNLFIPLPGIVDTMVLGRLDNESFLGGIALSTVIYSFIYWSVAFLRKGTTGLGAQAYGAQYFDELWAVLFRATAVALILSFVLLLFKSPIGQFAFWIFEASPEVENHANLYYQIRLWGMPASFLNFVFIGWLLALQDSKRPMIIQIVVNLLNVILDLIFVLGFDMTIEGVALATVISEYTGLMIGVYFIWQRRELYPEKGVQKQQILDSGKLKHLFVVNRELFVRSMLLMAAFAYQTSEAAKISDRFLAATVILGHLFHICSFGLDGFAHACETMVGRYIGAKDHRAFKAVCRAGFELGLIVALLMSFIYWIGGDLWISLFTSIPELIETIEIYMIWAVILPIVGMWCFIFDGIYFGATFVRETRNSMVISVALYLGAMQFLVPVWQGHGIMAGLCVLLALRGITQWAYMGRLTASIAPKE